MAWILKQWLGVVSQWTKYGLLYLSWVRVFAHYELQMLEITETIEHGTHSVKSTDVIRN